ncbi:MAG: hypothetical protein ACI8SE_000316 [Bacteroidia bacterium]|jgi:hypothetical protein
MIESLVIKKNHKKTLGTSLVAILILTFWTLSYAQTNRTNPVTNHSLLIIPTTFTENCDGYRCFEIKPELRIDSVDFVLLNRMGNVVLSHLSNHQTTFQLSEVLTNKFKESIKHDGPYYYTIRYQCQDSVYSQKGHINVILGL